MPLTRDEASALASANNLIEVNARLGLRNYLRECWRLRHFTWHYSIGRTIVATIQNNLGLIWDFLNPLLLSATYYLTFGVLLGTRKDSEQFLTFLIAGVFTWQLFTQTFTSATGSLAKNNDLADGLRLPKVLLPISAAIQTGLRSIPALLMLFPIAIMGGSTPNWWWTIVPLIFLLASMLGFGLGLFASRLVNAVRDIAQTIPLAIRVLMFMSGVFYDIDKRFATAPDVIRIVAQNNPAALLLKFTRSALMPEIHQTSVQQIAFVVILTVVLLVGGILLYWRGDTSDE